MVHIAQQKSHLRQSIRERILQMPAKERNAESRSVCRRMLPLIQEGSHICAYYPLKTEVDLRSLIRTLLERGDTVFLPCTHKDGLTFRQLTHLGDLHPGEYGIPEPSAHAPCYDPSMLDQVLVPGRAFDRHGRRLGRGNGGYDRWIAQHRKENPQTCMIGVAFECQIVQDVPCEAHDVQLDGIVTARGYSEAV